MAQSADGPRRMHGAVAVLVLAAAVVGSCGGAETGTRTQSGDPAGTATQAAVAKQGSLAACEGDTCTDAPPDCEREEECMQDLCAPESGGCEAVMRPFDDGDGLRACFDLRVTEVAAAADPAPAPAETTVDAPAGTDTGTAPPAETTATEGGEQDEEEEQEEQDEQDEGMTALDVECRGPAPRLEGLDVGALELERSDEGVAWADRPVTIRGEIVDGVFRVTEAP